MNITLYFIKINLSRLPVFTIDIWINVIIFLILKLTLIQIIMQQLARGPLALTVYHNLTSVYMSYQLIPHDPCGQTEILQQRHLKWKKNWKTDLFSLFCNQTSFNVSIYKEKNSALVQPLSVEVTVIRFFKHYTCNYTLWTYRPHPAIRIPNLGVVKFTL